jgi:hypothetical protein
MPSLASCIMPTLDLRRFALQPIRCFLGQDYAQEELVIVENSENRERVDGLLLRGIP